MLCAAWVGMFAGLLPRRVHGRWEIALLAAYAVVASYLYGLLMNLSGWPFLLGVQVPGTRVPGLCARRAPGGEPADLLLYTLLTSSGSFDTGRAVTTALAVVLLGPAVLTTLRRAARRALVVGTSAGQESVDDRAYDGSHRPPKGK